MYIRCTEEAAGGEYEYRNHHIFVDRAHKRPGHGFERPPGKGRTDRQPCGSYGSRRKEKKGPITLGNCPSIDTYDAVIFGSPVHGLSPSLEMKSYLTGLPTGQPKKASCFVTKGLGGGKRVNKQMKAICTEKGLEILETGIVTWPRKSSKAAREKLIDRFERA